MTRQFLFGDQSIGIGEIISVIFGVLFLILIIILIAIFLNKLLKYRHELKIARIQSSNLDPMQTRSGSFLILRRGIILVFIGLNLVFIPLFNSPTPLLFIPLTLGLAYLAIYFIHRAGILELFPENGNRKSSGSIHS